MKKGCLFLVMFIGLALGQLQAQSAPELMQQAQNSLENKNYGQAKTLFLRAYQAFASTGDFKQAIEAGVEVTSL